MAEFQKRKIGASLLQHCLDYGRKNGFDILWLGVWEKNEHAITFYKRWGFQGFGAHEFLLGQDRQRDILMKKSL